MKAIRQHAFGGPDELRLEEVPDPQPQRDEVRIRVESAGVHLLDPVIRRGEGNARVIPTLPMTPGREVAGVVEAVGPDVDDALIGQRVVAGLGVSSGGYAELAVANVASLHRVPGSIDADEAVTMIGTGRTTMAILELAEPSAEDIVVVTAAAGGIGSLLVQAACAAGAKVVAAPGGPVKTAFARDLGATAAVDYLDEGWPERIRSQLDRQGATLVLDGVGGEIGQQAMGSLGVGGRLVMYGSASGALVPLAADDLYRLGITASAAVGARILQRPGGLRDLETRAIQAAADGVLRPVIGQHFALADARDAHIAIESRSTTGKTVLRP